jgi:hypothetical protein
MAGICGNTAEVSGTATSSAFQMLDVAAQRE